MLIVVPIACGWAVEWPDQTTTAGLLQKAGEQSPAFAVSGDIGVYTRANLRQLIGATAERIFAYDYQWTVAATYRASEAGADVSVHIYRFGSDIDAFGAYSVDRDPKVPGGLMPLDRPTPPVAAYWRGNQLHVWRGPLYVRVVPSGLQESLKDAVLQLARTVLAKLPVAKTPAIFGIPPQRGLIVEAVKFHRRNVLKQPSLGSALSGLYGRRAPNKLDVDMELLLFVGQSPEAAEATYEALQAYLRKGGAPRPIAALGQAAFTIRHSHHGLTYVMRQGKYVVMLAQVKDKSAAEGFLREIGKNIRLAR